MIDLSSYEYAEAMYHFLYASPEVYNDFLERCGSEDLSLAEYISLYCLTDFELWLTSH